MSICMEIKLQFVKCIEYMISYIANSFLLKKYKITVNDVIILQKRLFITIYTVYLYHAVGNNPTENLKIRNYDNFKRNNQSSS